MAKISNKLAPKKEKTTAKKPMKKVMKSKKISQNVISEEKVKKVIKAKPADIKPRVDEISGKINVEYVKSGIEALRQVIAKNLEQKKELFDGEQTVLMQINLVKIPKCPARIVHFPLSHTLSTSASEICLFVPDLKQDEDDYEKAVKYYENLLEKKGVTTKIHQIIPLKQLRKEYSEFESKRKLSQFYDFYLTDGRIQGYVLKMFGNALKKSKKDLVAVKLEAKDLNNIIKKSLSNTSISIHSRGNTQAIKIGHTDMKDEEMADNVVSAFNALDKHLPGGAANVRSLMLKTGTSLAVPVYVTLKNSDEVNVPIITAPKTKGHRVVKDELSTQNNANVVVYPSGEVKTVPIKGGKKENLKTPTKKDSSPKKALPKSRKVIQKPTRKVLQKPSKSKKKAAIKENIKGILKEANTNGTQKLRARINTSPAKQNNDNKVKRRRGKGKANSPEKKPNVNNSVGKKKANANNSMEKKTNANKALEKKTNANKVLNKKTNIKKALEKKVNVNKASDKKTNVNKVLGKKANVKQTLEKKATVQKVLRNKRKIKN